MEFEAEFTHADVGKTLLNHLQSRLFFGDEQHAFSAVNGVCYYVGYRLALARSGRAVQNESRSLCRFRNRRVLRAVAGKRSYYSAGLALIFVLARKLIVFKLVRIC